VKTTIIANHAIQNAYRRSHADVDVLAKHQPHAAMIEQPIAIAAAKLRRMAADE
jgi:hypothetical protein